MIINEAGTYTLKYTATDDCGKTSTVDRELNVVKIPSLFGVEWDGSDATTWTRTDDAVGFANPSPAVANGTGSSPFDDFMPWSGMEIVADAEAGTLVSIPKFWYKWTRNGNAMKLQISNKPIEGFLTSPAHADRGDGVGERDVVYVGRYHCLVNTYKSSIGDIPQGQRTRSDFRTNIHSLGNDIWQYDFAMYWTICMLYLVEFANWNSQDCIGYGCNYNNVPYSNGRTDSMQYHTGTVAQTRDTYDEIQYRHIEGLWSNVYDFVDGIYFSGTSIYAINNPSLFSDNSNGTLVGTRASSNGVPTSFTEPSASGYEYALYPSATDGENYTVRTCDTSYYSSSGICIGVGGTYTNGQNSGLFCMIGSYSATSKSSNLGSRLMKLPSA